MATENDFMNLRRCKTPEIHETWEVLDILTSNLSMATPEIIVTNRATTLISSMPVLAAQNTLISVDFCVRNGFLSDAFVLLRKYRDDLLLYLYLCYRAEDIGENPIEIEQPLSNGMSSDDFLEYVIEYLKEKQKRDSENKEKEIIEKWNNGDYTQNTPRDVKKTFGVAGYCSTLSTVGEKDYGQDLEIKEVYQKIESCLTQLGEELNNYVHVNAPDYLRCNGFLSVPQGKRKSNALYDMLQKITIVFLSLLAMIKPTFFMADDYIDILEITGERIDGLQYRVPTGILGYLEKFADKVSPEILEYINDHNPVGMKFVDK